MNLLLKIILESPPLTYTLRSKHTRRFPLMHFDEEKGYQRELRYASNQRSVFTDVDKA